MVANRVKDRQKGERRGGSNGSETQTDRKERRGVVVMRVRDGQTERGGKGWWQ